MKALGIARLSRDTDTSTSIARQREQIELAAKLRGDDLVAIVEDRDTSGAVRPFDRPKLAPWLNGRAHEYDTIIVAKLDRLTRSLFDFADVVQWCDRNGKALVSVAESIDLATPHGRMIANVLASFAQFERERMSERRREAAAKVRASGRWDGGVVPYGYAPVPVPGGWSLGQDKVTGPIAIGMVADAIAGRNLSEIAHALNDADTPSPRGRGPWRSTSVARILTAPTLIGHQCKKDGDAIIVERDASGQPVMMTDTPLITDDRFGQLQDALATNARGRSQPQARHLLAGIAFCGYVDDDGNECGLPVRGHRRIAKPKDGANRANAYTCQSGKGGHARINLDRADDLVSALVLHDAGERVVHVHRRVPGDDHAAEIAKLVRRAERYRADLADDPDDDLARTLARTEKRIAALRADHQPETWGWVPDPSGELVRDLWARSDTAARNRILVDWGARMVITRERARFTTGALVVDSDEFRVI